MRLNRSPKPGLVARFRRVVNSAFRRQAVCAAEPPRPADFGTSS